MCIRDRLHAAGVGPDPAGCCLGQADTLEKLRNTSRRRTVELGKQVQVLAPRLTLVEILLFEHEIDKRLHTLALAHDIETGDERAPACRTRAPRQLSLIHI